MNRTLRTCFLLLTFCHAAVADETPVAAEIVDVPTERRDSPTPVGNVRVTFADGRTELWTSLGRCLRVQRSASGLVGWTHFTSRTLNGDPMNNRLRVLTASGRWQEMTAGQTNQIRSWDFAENDTAVIVVSINRGGWGIIQRFSLETGQQTGWTRVGAPAAEVPAWALPYAGSGKP